MPTGHAVAAEWDRVCTPSRETHVGQRASERTSAETVRQFWEEAWTAGRVEVLADIFHPDLTENGEAVDVAAFQSGVTTWRGIFPDFSATVEELLPIGDDRVVTRVTYRGTHRVMNEWRRLCGPIRFVIPAAFATWRTIRAAASRVIFAPAGPRNNGPSSRSPMARSSARAVRGASGMVTVLPPLRCTTSVR